MLETSAPETIIEISETGFAEKIIASGRKVILSGNIPSHANLYTSVYTLLYIYRIIYR